MDGLHDLFFILLLHDSANKYFFIYYFITFYYTNLLNVKCLNFAWPHFFLLQFLKI